MLPDGMYRFEIDTTVEDAAIGESTIPGDSFNYFAGTFRVDNVSVTVPAPGALGAQAIALSSLVALARRRPRRRH